MSGDMMDQFRALASIAAAANTWSLARSEARLAASVETATRERLYDGTTAPPICPEHREEIARVSAAATRAVQVERIATQLLVEACEVHRVVAGFVAPVEASDVEEALARR